MEESWEDGLRNRLQWLAEKHGQAQLARKTGSSRQNVSRYVKGRRVPMEFGASLVQGMGVNPAWLLVGEGSPFLSDVSAETAETASDLLGMVRAMEAVSRRRLGELAGKDYARTLRELNDTLQSFERLRKRLDDQTRPMLKRLIDDMTNAIGNGELTHARQLNEACTQLTRLCHDPELHDAHREVEGYLHHRLGHTERALQLAEEVFLRRMGRSARDAEWTRNAHNFVVGLLIEGHIRQARRMCNAALAVMGDGNAEPDYYHRQLMLSGLLDSELGDLRGALAKLPVAASYVNRDRYPAVEGTYHFIQLLSGALRLERCLRIYRKGERMHRRLLAFACWQEEEPTLQHAYELTVGRVDDPDEDVDPLYRHARNLLKAVSGEAFEEMEVPGDPFHAGVALVANTQMQRVAGNTRKARKLAQEAAAMLAKIPGERMLPLLTRATHHRNVLELQPQKSGAKWQALEQQAREFFTTHAHAGYACFKEWADSDPGEGFTDFHRTG